jgi:hypothetical protein
MVEDAFPRLGTVDRLGGSNESKELHVDGLFEPVRLQGRIKLVSKSAELLETDSLIGVHHSATPDQTPIQQISLVRVLNVARLLLEAMLSW